MKEKTNKDNFLKIVGCAKGYSREYLGNNLSRHNKFNPILGKQINMLPEAFLRNSGTPLAKKIIKMMREVNTEAYRAQQFTRTQINNRGVLFGVILLKHKVEDLVVNYFHKRWPNYVICLFNEYTRKTIIMDEKGKLRITNSSLKETVENVSKSHPIIPYFNDIQFSNEEIFEVLYESQLIDERKNIKYFKKMIPDKCFKLPGMRNSVEKRINNRKISDFL